MMKQFMHKTRKSGGLKRYKAPMGYTRTSMMWGKWETIGKFNTLLEASDVLKYVRAVMVFGPGSTAHQITFGGKRVFHLESANWPRIRNRLDTPEMRAEVEAYEKHLRDGND